MKFMKSLGRLFVSGLVCGVAFAALQQTTFAWGSGAHYVIMQKTSNNYLQSNSTIAAAMKAYPSIAAWGAMGPDLGYGEIRMALGGYAPWGDMFHYDRVGSFSTQLLKNALASGDQKKIAFAGGYLTHVIGDMNCHGTLVNPECGVYMDNPSGKDAHQRLEKAADSYVWVALGNKSSESYSVPGVNPYFGTLLADFFAENISAFYGSISADEMRGTTGWENLVRGFGIGNGAPYSDALNYLNPVRLNRLHKAFEDSCYQAAVLLAAAERGDYSGFKDSWNLDAANEDRPFGTLKVQISTSSDALSGTDDDVYFGMEFTDGRTYEKLLDKEGYNDFEMGDNDPYYLYVGDNTLYPQNVKRVWIRKKYNWWSDDWKVKDISISVNGVNVFSQSLNRMLNKNTKQINMYVNGIAPDLQGPTASSVTYSYTPGSTLFTVTVSGLSDPSGISYVSFPTWSAVSGQDDIVWYQGTKVGEGVWQCTVNAQNHYMPSLPIPGDYYTHVYAWDSRGNYRCLGGVTVNVVH